MCTVYKAKIGAQVVVVKKLTPTSTIMLRNNEKSCLLREMRCLRTLCHPNIIKLLHVVLEPDVTAVVTEYAVNSDILNFIFNQYVCSSLRVKLLCDVARGVNYLHCLPKSIIHNDLKAHNVLITDSFVAKVADFGLAEKLSRTTSILFGGSDSAMKATGATNTHRSPERWKNAANFTDKSDVYSFAILMWEVFNDDEEPFVYCRTDQDLRREVCENNSRPPVNPAMIQQATSELIELMTACWDGDADNRPAMKTVLVTLENIVSEPEAAKKINKNLTSLGLPTWQANACSVSPTETALNDSYPVSTPEALKETDSAEGLFTSHADAGNELAENITEDCSIFDVTKEMGEEEDENLTSLITFSKVYKFKHTLTGQGLFDTSFYVI